MEHINMEKVGFNEVDQTCYPSQAFFWYDGTQEEFNDFLQYYATNEIPEGVRICSMEFCLEIFVAKDGTRTDYKLEVCCTATDNEQYWPEIGWYKEISDLIDAFIEKLPEEYIPKEYKFKVTLGEYGYCGGNVTVMATDESEAEDLALTYVCDRLAEALPELDIAVSVSMVDKDADTD